jgi:hypothetical protein
MNHSPWRAAAEYTVRKALAAALERGYDRKQTQALIRSAYPFGERANYPYKVWLDTVRRMLPPEPPAETELELT